MAHDLQGLLVPVGGWIVPALGPQAEVEAGYGTIAIDFAPFRLPPEVAEEWDEDPDEDIETSLRLDFIRWPGLEAPALTNLAGRSFSFPRNPDEGYIDASVYLLHEHHRIDVTEIAFGEVRDGTTVPATLVLDLELEDEVEGLSAVPGARMKCDLVERTKRPD